jgi:hypothetical protein
MATGHAVGTMAAMAAMEGRAPAALDMARLQATLRAQGAVIERPDQPQSQETKNHA